MNVSNLDLNTKIGKLPPKERTIVPPKEGWKTRKTYAVLISLRPENPIWSALFFSGYIEGQPQGYNVIMHPHISEKFNITDCHYLEVIGEINFDFNL